MYYTKWLKVEKSDKVQVCQKYNAAVCFRHRHIGNELTEK